MVWRVLSPSTQSDFSWFNRMALLERNVNLPAPPLNCHFHSYSLLMSCFAFAESQIRRDDKFGTPN